jgi:hypothetical protein
LPPRCCRCHCPRSSRRPDPPPPSNAAYAKYKGLKEGKNADYIPALAKVNPDLFGIAVVTADGKVYTAGDVKTEVSIQSISKVFTMALVMNQQGPDAVLNGIGADATGACASTRLCRWKWSLQGPRPKRTPRR